MDASRQAVNRDGTSPMLIMEILAITGRTFVDFVNVRPNIRSFQHQVNWDKNTIEIGAFAIGVKICTSTCQFVAPSIFADSQISEEIPIRKFLSTNMAKGILMAQ